MNLSQITISPPEFKQIQELIILTVISITTEFFFLETLHIDFWMVLGYFEIRFKPFLPLFTPLSVKSLDARGEAASMIISKKILIYNNITMQ